MGAMPFRRAGVGHRLHHLVFGRKRRGAALGFATHSGKGVAPESARIAERLGNHGVLIGWVDAAERRNVA